MTRQRGHVRSIKIRKRRASMTESNDVSIPHANERHPVPADMCSNTPHTTFARLPVELIHEVLFMSADACGANNRATVASIARACCLGYTIAIPRLYRVVVANLSNYIKLYACLFEEHSTFTNGILREPAVRRLCPLVQHLVLRASHSLSRLTPDRFQHLNRLSSIFFDCPAVIPPHILGTTRIHFGVGQPRSLPSSVTHMSFSVPFEHYSYLEDFLVFDETGDWSPAVTHLSLEFNDRIRHDDQLTSLLENLLDLPNIEQIVIRLSGEALNHKSRAVILRSIHPVGDDNRIRLWDDYRQLDGEEANIKAVVADAYLGRTPWTEAHALSENELEEAASASRSYQIFGTSESEDSEERYSYDEEPGNNSFSRSNTNTDSDSE